MTCLKNEEAKQILLLAPALLGESLESQLEKSGENIQVSLSAEQLIRHPNLVIWYFDNNEIPAFINDELIRLKEKWFPSPILLILPKNLNLRTEQLLDLDCKGIIQEPSLKVLKETIELLINGGRVVKLNENKNENDKSNKLNVGLGQWLLLSGVYQINEEISIINNQLTIKSNNFFKEFILEGRKRELNQAKNLLHIFWGNTKYNMSNNRQDKKLNTSFGYKTEITIDIENPYAVLDQISSRVNSSIKKDLINNSGNLLALEALRPKHKSKLLISIFEQFELLIKKIKSKNNTDIDSVLIWEELQTELRKESIRNLIGQYVRINFEGEDVSFDEKIISMIDLTASDEELPKPVQMISGLVNNKPIVVNGINLPPEDPRALILLEKLVINWLVRTAEIISAEFINASAEWPEIRQLILSDEFISTRELDRYRNQLNSQAQLQNLIQRPINLYESKRGLFTFSNNEIKVIYINEARDKELEELSWIPKQVALLIELRDALSPQIQALVKYIGDIMVIILTKVIGRAIGLIGKGIAQGMGRTLSKG